ANGATQFVEKLSKFSPEMAIHYASFSIAKGCTATISVTVKESFSSYTLSPKSKKLTATKNGNTITFDSGTNYLILKIDSKELLFIFIDEKEADPPKVGDSNVKSIADYDVDDKGATLETSKIQSAINAASGAAQNILYFPPGRYKVGELSMKSDMTLYLAAGAILDGSTNTGDYAAAGPAVEDTTHGVLHMNNVTNANILGRGVIDGNGSVIRGSSNDTPAFKIDVMRIDQSSKILVDGIHVRDSVFWNTLVYNSDQVTIRNYKVVNRRPTTTTYNQTDGIDFDCSTNGSVYNAFVYSGDDSLSPKREQEGKLDTNNIVYEKVVAYTNSAATKVGTKTFGTSIDAVTFKDIDVVKAGRAMVIDANDTAAIKNTKWENIRVEAADSNLIDIEEDRAPDWRTAPNTSTVKDAYFTNVASEVKQLINIHGKSSSVTVNGVHFSNFTVQGKKLTSQSDAAASWSINQYVSNITFE
ncbi:MAG TPA: glycosyl hydrolase family 28 protein, partial [Polyangiaceae bacterium]